MDHILPTPYIVVLLWSIAVLLGMIGLGRLVALIVGGESAENAGWGLHAVWGMAVYLFLGASLSVCAAADGTGITLLIALGVTAMLVTTVRRGLPTIRQLANLPWQMWPVFAVLALTFFGGLYWQKNVNPSDDLPAYFAFCEKLLSTGTFDEPFSWRRLASLGGHTLLQCSILARTSFANAQVFEISLCPVILVGLILGFRRSALARSPIGLMLALLAATTPIIRANTTSHFTGVVLFAGLFVTLDLTDTERSQRPRWLALGGLIAAAVCSLRAHYIPAAMGALGLYWLASWIVTRRSTRDASLEAASWSAALLVALLPWMIMSYRSNDSPLFPLFQGGNNLAFNPLALDEPIHKRAEPVLQMLLHPALFPLILCLVAIPDWRRNLAARAMAISAVLASLILAYSITLAPDPITVPRYVQPLLVAAALAALMSAAVSQRGRMISYGLGLFVIVLSVPDRREHLWKCYQSAGERETVTKRIAASRDAADHLHAQLLIPEGKRILVCSATPFLFDFRRNPIWITDLPHATSPAPGLPFQKSPEETKRYLRTLGVEHVIFMECAGNSFYSRARREREGAGDIALLRIWAPFFLDFISTVEHLAASETILGRSGDLVAFHFKP